MGRGKAGVVVARRCVRGRMVLNRNSAVAVLRLRQRHFTKVIVRSENPSGSARRLASSCCLFITVSGSAIRCASEPGSSARRSALRFRRLLGAGRSSQTEALCRRRRRLGARLSWSASESVYRPRGDFLLGGKVRCECGRRSSCKWRSGGEPARGVRRAGRHREPSTASGGDNFRKKSSASISGRFELGDSAGVTESRRRTNSRAAR